ncbi:MAG: response regulator [Alphaproteobacteria bacterium]|nr:response regulator [Alphaproteobacteria bacterium]MDP6875122.1 response regulator [Alphaproteobacteria bacterium]
MSNKLFKAASVMVVDDAEFDRRHVCRILEQVGIGEILTAESGADALERLGEREADLELDLIVCDIEMPEMDGYEFIRRLRYGALKPFQHVPVLDLTGVDTDKNVQTSKFLKIDGFVVKPANAKDFSRLVRRIIAEGMRRMLDAELEAP